MFLVLWLWRTVDSISHKFSILSMCTSLSFSKWKKMWFEIFYSEGRFFQMNRVLKMIWRHCVIMVRRFLSQSSQKLVTSGHNWSMQILRFQLVQTSHQHLYLIIKPLRYQWPLSFSWVKNIRTWKAPTRPIDSNSWISNLYLPCFSGFLPPKLANSNGFVSNIYIKKSKSLGLFYMCFITDTMISFFPWKCHCFWGFLTVWSIGHW